MKAFQSSLRRNVMDFQNKTCVVIGASGGIGGALVRELDIRGARVIQVARSAAASKARKTLFVDLEDLATVRRLVKVLRTNVKTIDCLFNATGIAAYKPLSRMAESEIETVLRVNLYGAIVLTQRCIPLMRRRGSIVHLSSMAGIAPGHKFFAVYAASKQGLVGFLRAATVEFPHLRFLAVTPAGVNTAIASRAIGARELSAKFHKSALESAEVVVKGMLDNLDAPRSDVHLFPTRISREAYAAAIL